MEENLEKKLERLAFKYETRVQKCQDILTKTPNDMVEGLKMGYEDILLDIKLLLTACGNLETS